MTDKKTDECLYCKKLSREHPAGKDTSECKHEFMRKKYAELASTAMMFADEWEELDLKKIDDSDLIS